MKKQFLAHLSGILLALFATFSFPGCVKDNCMQTYTVWEPVYKTTAEVRANIRSNAPREIEQPGKIYVRGNYIFLNEIDRGIHIIDNRNPRSPNRIAFVDIPGNIDMAVKGDILYADLYTDLVTIDITDPLNIVLKDFKENIFPQRYWGGGFSGDSSKVIVDWVQKQITVDGDCGGRVGFFSPRADVLTLQSGGGNAFGNASGNASSPFGIGGSMARFAIVNNWLYTLTESSLKVFSINNPSSPVFSNTVDIGMWIETIYPFNDKLFIGSNTSVFIYGLSNPASPQQLGRFAHARTCDPVIADNNFAYVTLRSGTPCLGFIEQLDILDISNISAPSLIRTYPMTNPHGLAKDGIHLIICDGRAGLKFYDAASPLSGIVLKKTIEGLETYDVIAYGGWALVVAKDGLYQYSYDAAFNVTELSKLTITRQ